MQRRYPFRRVFGAGKFSPQEVCWGYRLHGAFFTLQYPWFLWPDSPVIFVPNHLRGLEDGAWLPVWQWLQWLADRWRETKHGGKNARCVKVFHFRKPGSSVGLESHFFNMTLQEYKISIWIDMQKNCPTFFWVYIFFHFQRAAAVFCLGQVPPTLLSVDLRDPRSSTCSGRSGDKFRILEWKAVKTPRFWGLQVANTSANMGMRCLLNNKGHSAARKNPCKLLMYNEYFFEIVVTLVVGWLDFVDQ